MEGEHMKSRLILSVAIALVAAWSLVASFKPTPEAALLAPQYNGVVAERIQRVENGLLISVTAGPTKVSGVRCSRTPKPDRGRL